MIAVYLKPKSGYRTPLRSDTLWGIICWGIRNLYGEAELVQFIESYSSNPPLFISSAFPFLGDLQDGQLKVEEHFFPKPFLPPISAIEGKELEDYQRIKDFKKIKYLSLADFQAVLNGTLNNDDIFERIKKGQNTIVPPKRELYSVTHNRIDRLKGYTLEVKGQGQLFHTDEYHFTDKKEAGLFFLAKGEVEKWLYPVLRYYSHIGMGGDYSIGKGVFDIYWKDVVIQETEQADALINLSLYYPKIEEELPLFNKNKNFRYLLERRSGRVGQHRVYREKESLYFFREGSIFPTTQTSRSNWGSVFVDEEIKKEEEETKILGHPIYRYGMGFMLKMKIKS
ncbi:MAG: type III-A CRISPR-associated RAMP protein Csm4 [Bacteroidota bacterium]